MTRISLLGSSSGRNAGDAALIRAIVEAVANEIPGAHFEIPTINPSFLRAAFSPEQVTPVSIMPWNLSLKFLGPPTFASVARCDATLVFDAVLFDRALWNPLFNYLSSLQILLPFARRRGRKVVFYNVGVGPIHGERGRSVLRRTLAAGDLFTIRDPDSLALAESVGLPAGRPVLLTADAAFNHPPVDRARAGRLLATLDLPAGRPLVGFNVNAYLDTWASAAGGRIDTERFVRVMAEIADRMVRRWQATVVFFVTQHMDRSITERVRGAMTESASARLLSNQDHSPEELQGAMAETDLFFGMRFHSLLLAVSQLTPIVGLVYQHKVSSLFQQLEMPEAVLTFERFGVDEVWSTLDTQWSRRAETRTRLQPIVQTMKTRALEAAVRTAALLGEGRRS